MDLEAEHLMNQQQSWRSPGSGRNNDFRQRDRRHTANEEAKSFGAGRRGPEDSEQASEPYIERCKKVGRLGPKETKLDPKSAYGDVIFSGRDQLDVEAISSLASIRANTAVFSGRYYFEVLLKTRG